MKKNYNSRTNRITTNKKPIGVFDSGLGGLSILSELRRILPLEDYVFLADQAHVPYGEKTQSQLRNLALRITNYFIKHDIKLIVIACNTSTCYSIEYLRGKFDLPFVGTIPAIKPASENTVSNCIAVISTPATSKSSVLKKLIRDYCKGIEVINISCLGLENAIETGNLDSRETTTLLNKYLSPIKRSGTDQLVLGCTHYPFLKKNIKKMLGKKIKLVDSGRAVAKMVRNTLKNKGWENSCGGRIFYFTTGDENKFSAVASRLLGSKILTSRVKI